MADLEIRDQYYAGTVSPRITEMEMATVEGIGRPR